LRQEALPCRCAEKTPLANLWLTLLETTGVKTESHGDSTGVIKEILF